MRAIIGILLFLAIIVETTLIPLPFALLLITLVASIWSKESIYWAFAAGIVLDIFAFRLLGISSIFFLATVWSAGRFRKKFHQGWVYYQLFVLIGIIVLYSFIIYHHIDMLSIIIASISGALVLFVVRNLIPAEDERKKLSL